MYLANAISVRYCPASLASTLDGCVLKTFSDYRTHLSRMFRFAVVVVVVVSLLSLEVSRFVFIYLSIHPLRPFEAGPFCVAQTDLVLAGDLWIFEGPNASASWMLGLQAWPQQAFLRRGKRDSEVSIKFVLCYWLGLLFSHVCRIWWDAAMYWRGKSQGQHHHL